MTDAENPHAGQGMVVLDIGGDVGALVVSTPADMAGVEIEICPSGRRGHEPDEGLDWWIGEWRSHDHPSDGPVGHGHRHARAAWPHVAVIPRPSPTGLHPCAVYPGLVEGTYDLWVRPDGPTVLTVSVVGAQVTTADWP
ncbi:hypothetical protein [Allobranchiibius sp. GilTou38]|uniref:hypothetical protein n=1 Tax=Allobranchiibius sp. GilTou38 TaxID=2815210 RepID=UPI001AA0CA78|nr:hypothetical protein [Allobranchiibius sp. GilTou38]MBO1766733.1 hypothetical protein [Allobranchiibius sp. GilTou38]